MEFIFTGQWLRRLILGFAVLYLPSNAFGGSPEGESKNSIPQKKKQHSGEVSSEEDNGIFEEVPLMGAPVHPEQGEPVVGTNSRVCCTIL